VENEIGTPTFSYYIHDGPSAFSVELAGIWTAEGAKKLERDWQNSSPVIGRKELIVDLILCGGDRSASASTLAPLVQQWAADRSKHAKIASTDRVNHWVVHSFNLAHPEYLEPGTGGVILDQRGNQAIRIRGCGAQSPPDRQMRRIVVLGNERLETI
jgi:hypothetical protein